MDLDKIMDYYLTDLEKSKILLQLAVSTRHMLENPNPMIIVEEDGKIAEQIIEMKMYEDILNEEIKYCEKTLNIISEYVKNLDKINDKV